MQSWHSVQGQKNRKRKLNVLHSLFWSLSRHCKIRPKIGSFFSNTQWVTNMYRRVVKKVCLPFRFGRLWRLLKKKELKKKISLILCIPLYICFPLWCCSRRVIYCFRSSSDNETGRRTKLRFLEAKAHEMKLFMVFLFPERCLGMRSFFRRFSRFFFARRYAISQPSSWLRRDWY